MRGNTNLNKVVMPEIRTLEYRVEDISGGESGIRTRDTVPRIHTFQACAFNHSATSPSIAIVISSDEQN